jgi:hypothetical protein
MLSAMAQCYLLEKMADTMHSHKKMIISCPSSWPWFLHSFPHNWVRKCLDFLPFIDNFSILHWQGTMYRCLLYYYILYLYSPFFSKQRTDVAAKKRFVTHNQWQDGVRKCQCCFEERCPKVTTATTTTATTTTTLLLVAQCSVVLVLATYCVISSWPQYHHHLLRYASCIYSYYVQPHNPNPIGLG